MPFVKGQSGNKNGRPRKGLCYADMLEKAVKNLRSVHKDSDGRIVSEQKGKAVIAEAVVELATNKKYPPQVRLQAIREIFDRTDGKPRQSVEMSADVESVVKHGTADVKARLDALSPEERETYFKLCEKADASSS